MQIILQRCARRVKSLLPFFVQVKNPNSQNNCSQESNLNTCKVVYRSWSVNYTRTEMRCLLQQTPMINNLLHMLCLLVSGPFSFLIVDTGIVVMGGGGLKCLLGLAFSNYLSLPIIIIPVCFFFQIKKIRYIFILLKNTAQP